MSPSRLRIIYENDELTDALLSSPDTGPERQTGRKAQTANILAAKVSITSPSFNSTPLFPPSSLLIELATAQIYEICLTPTPCSNLPPRCLFSLELKLTFELSPFLLFRSDRRRRDQDVSGSQGHAQDDPRPHGRYPVSTLYPLHPQFAKEGVEKVGKKEGRWKDTNLARRASSPSFLPRPSFLSSPIPLPPKPLLTLLLWLLGSRLTNDGNAILREIEVAHPAAKSMIELSRTQDEEVGDGTTSVIILGELAIPLLSTLCVYS